MARRGLCHPSVKCSRRRGLLAKAAHVPPPTQPYTGQFEAGGAFVPVAAAEQGDQVGEPEAPGPTENFRRRPPAGFDVVLSDGTTTSREELTERSPPGSTGRLRPDDRRTGVRGAPLTLVDDRNQPYGVAVNASGEVVGAVSSTYDGKGPAKITPLPRPRPTATPVNETTEIISPSPWSSLAKVALGGGALFLVAKAVL